MLSSNLSGTSTNGSTPVTLLTIPANDLGCKIIVTNEGTAPFELTIDGNVWVRLPGGPESFCPPFNIPIGASDVAIQVRRATGSSVDATGLYAFGQ